MRASYTRHALDARTVCMNAHAGHFPQPANPLQQILDLCRKLGEEAEYVENLTRVLSHQGAIHATNFLELEAREADTVVTVLLKRLRRKHKLPASAANA